MVHLVREHPTEATQHKKAHPSEINREVIRRTISYVHRALDPNPNVLLHGARLAGEVQANPNKTRCASKIRHALPGRRPRYYWCLKALERG